MGISHEAFYLLVGEAAGENSMMSAANLLAGRELVGKNYCRKSVSRKLAAALLPLLANGKTSHAMHDTFRELHQQIRCNADEQAAQAVLELAQ